MQTSRSSEAAHIKFGAFPTAPQMSNWRTDFLYKCAAAHPIPKAAFQWASEIEDAESYEELAEDGAGYNAKFVTMEAKIATGVLEILHGDLRRKVDFTKTVHARKKPPQMITGREIVWRIYDHNKISRAAHVVREFSDLIEMELRGDNLS